MDKSERRRLQRQFRKGFDPYGPCAICHEVTRAGVADHIIPVTMGGEWTPENRQRLCGKCHGAKTQAEYRDPFSVL
jgi:5-methylcytosine-specific restriction endonuclease McrA